MTLPIGRPTLRRAVMGLAIFGGIAGWPARAEDSGFWETIRAMSGERSFAPEPAPSFSPRPRFRRAAARVAPTAAAPPPPARVARPAPVVVPVPDIKPVDPAQRPNPLATLLSDATLRPGDIVVFPDGARVFRGEPGSRHAMADFVPVSRAKDISASMRKVVAALPVGQNTAWSSAAVAAKGQIAQGGPDVETTGSLAKGRGRR